MAETINEAHPGYKTTEFWLSTVATLIGILMASGLVAPDSQIAQLAGSLMAILSPLGYTAQRGYVKAKQ